MAKAPDIKRKDLKFETVEFFVCACSGCGRKQEVFSDEIHAPRFCETCGDELDLSRCGFESSTKKTI